MSKRQAWLTNLVNLHFSKTIVTQCSELQVLVLGIWSYLHLLDWFNGNISLERVGVNRGTPEISWFSRFTYLSVIKIISGKSLCWWEVCPFLSSVSPFFEHINGGQFLAFTALNYDRYARYHTFIMGKAFDLGMQCYCKAIFWEAELRAAIDLEFASRFLT